MCLHACVHVSVCMCVCVCDSQIGNKSCLVFMPSVFASVIGVISFLWVEGKTYITDYTPSVPM